MKFEISPKEYEIEELNWGEANFYCHFLNYNGLGWRLPTKDELNEIYDLEHDFKNDWYWTGTEYDDLHSWFQNFDNGYQGRHGKKNFCMWVRAIRDL